MNRNAQIVENGFLAQARTTAGIAAPHAQVKGCVNRFSP